MSRSRKKTPIHSIACVKVGEMKKWKKQMSKCFRRIPIDADIPKHKKYVIIWDSPSDGKHYMNDREKREKWMRK